MRWTSIILAVAVLLAVEPVEGETTASSFAVLRDKLVVSVSINGVGPYPFLLDWHVGRPVVDRDVAQFLNLEAVPDSHVEAQDAAGHTGSGWSVKAGQFQAAALPAESATCLVMDLKEFRASLGSPIAGVVNVRSMAGALGFDFGSGALDLKPRNCGPVLRATDDGVVRFKFADSGAPVVSALVNGRHARDFAVDLACGGAVAMGTETLKDLSLLTDATPRLRVSPGAQDAGGEPGSAQIRLQSIRVAGVEIRDPICLVDPGAAEPRLGIGFLKHFRVTFDFNEHRLRLEPVQSRSIQEGPLTGTGISLAYFRDGYWVLWIAEDSPAAKAGLESGATLIEIGGKEARDLSYSAAVEWLAVAPDAMLDVTITQRGEVRKVLLSAQKLL